MPSIPPASRHEINGLELCIGTLLVQINDLILRTPTGSLRTQLCDLHIVLNEASAQAKCAVAIARENGL